jgi:predicted transcriptional regulator YdeE
MIKYYKTKKPEYQFDGRQCKNKNSSHKKRKILNYWNRADKEAVKQNSQQFNHKQCTNVSPRSRKKEKKKYQKKHVQYR